MKKLLFCFVMIAGLSSGFAFSWEPSDLTRYPGGMEAGDLILNFGAAFDVPEYSWPDYMYIPPVHATFDYNLPIGAKKLPFFIGGTGGYSGYGYKDDWFYSKIYIGGRFGYHFNWGITNLDTYAAVTAGWIIYTGDGIAESRKYGWPLIGVNLGVRYFFNSVFGVYAETGYSIGLIDLGLAFKF
jgi:opacity protein-like surface antigen